MAGYKRKCKEIFQKCEEPNCKGVVSSDVNAYLFAGKCFWGIANDCSVCGRLYSWQKNSISPLYCDGYKLFLVNHRVVCVNGQGLLAPMPLPMSVKYL